MGCIVLIFRLIIRIVILATALCLVLPAAAVGIIKGTYVSLRNLVSGLWNVYVGRKPNVSFSFHIDLNNSKVRVRETYFYWTGRWASDYAESVKKFCRSNRADASRSWYNAKYSLYGNVYVKAWGFLYNGFTSLFIWIWALVLIPVLSIVLAVVTITIMLTTNSLAMILHVVERLYLSVLGFSVLCPHCHRKPQNTVPLYKCPKCGTMHAGLLPSVRYGAFYQVCQCGKKLPTSRFFGRRKLRAFCSHRDCRAAFDKGIESVVVSTVAFIGSPCVGKTCLLMDTVSELLNKSLPDRGFHADYPTVDDERRVEGLLACYEKGQKPDSTHGEVKALCIDVKGGVLTSTRRLYLYDPPGEVFGGHHTIASQLYYRHLAIAIVVIDPFTILDVANIRKTHFPEEAITTGTVPPDESLNKWALALEQDFPKMTKNVFCIVLINKADSPGLQRYCNIHPGDSGEPCEAFLEEHGMGNMITSLKDKFRQYCIYAVSAQSGFRAGKKVTPAGFKQIVELVLKELGI